MKTTQLAHCSILLIVAASFGCSPQGGSSKGPPPVVTHAERGPHGGELIVFGEHAYHAEVVFDEAAEKTTLYVLDGQAKNSVAVAAQQPAMHIEVGGQEKEFAFSSAPIESDPEGQSSRFEIESHDLLAALKTEAQDQAELEMTFDGKMLHGKFELHGHHGHSHSHGADDHSAEILVWHSEDIDLQGNKIAIGQHGLTVHAGEELEPAVTITSGDKAVTDAQVHVSLISSDGESVLAAEEPMEFEPATEDEPAHYAGAALTVPSDAGQVIIRYRVELAGGAATGTYDSGRLTTEKDD